jgi:FKBP-type peptidyl-prolyl cis-trans isomerase FkpA
MSFRVVTVCVLAAAVSACKSNTPTSPSQNVNVPYSATDLRVGTGAEAVNGRTATVLYTGWLYDPSAAQNKGRQFDAGQFSFVVGSGGVIAGFNQAVTGMRVGGQRRAVLPPNLAYGSAGAGSIPPNATLVFDIELTNVQ